MEGKVAEEARKSNKSRMKRYWFFAPQSQMSSYLCFKLVNSPPLRWQNVRLARFLLVAIRKVLTRQVKGVNEILRAYFA